MSTVRSSTDSAVILGQLAHLGRSWTDMRSMLSFRASSLTATQTRRLRIAGGLVLAITLASAIVPAYVRGHVGLARVSDIITLMPTFYLAFLVLTVIAAIASGGGRELIPREQAVAFPVSTWTEHFGALLLAPLNIAWLLQAWTLLGGTSYALGPQRLWAAVVPVVVWIVAATAIGQAVGWLVEGVRRTRHGRVLTRTAMVLSAASGCYLVVTEQVTTVLDEISLVSIFIAAADGSSGAWLGWASGTARIAAVGAGAILIGGLVAHRALRLPQREESRLDSGTHQPRTNPGSDLAAMIRIDRSSIWRSVPLRRGVIVLALLPGVVSASGALDWDLITILPGLVASGAGLLFGVNAWCLDGRGALWRDSLPVSQGQVFLAKTLVLFELLLTAAGVTVVVAALRAGVPTSAELAATLCAAVTVSAAVVSGCMRWSIARPFAVDMRSARATPAPPVVMVGYSARLAVATTFIGLLFSGMAYAPDWRYPVLVAIPMLAFSGLRLSATARRWQDPQVRARVIATVAT